MNRQYIRRVRITEKNAEAAGPNPARSTMPRLHRGKIKITP
jgi:hypothetical protein